MISYQIKIVFFFTKKLISTESVKAQGGHQPGKPGKVREFESGQGKVRENVFFSMTIKLSSR